MGSKSALQKKKIITHYIYNGGSTIVDLSKELNLSIPTVAKLVNEMCEEGYLKDYGKLETEGGRHPILYGLNPDSGYFVGVDIKKFSLDIGLINFKGDIVDLQMNLPYNFENTPEAMDTLCEMVKDFIRHVSEELSHKILNVCINISGRVNPEAGYSYSIFNFSERPLDEILTQKIGYQVSIDNDTRAMTYGEYLQGCVKGEKNILFINISWGLGMGIIINGRIYMGKSGFSGEMEVREVCPQEGRGHEEDRRTEVEVGGGLRVVGDCPPFAAWGTFHVQRSPETDGTADTDVGQRHPVITHSDLPEVCCQDVACQVDAVVWYVIFVPGGGTDGEEGESQHCEGEEGARKALRESLKHTTFHILFWA